MPAKADWTIYAWIDSYKDTHLKVYKSEEVMAGDTFVVYIDMAATVQQTAEGWIGDLWGVDGPECWARAQMTPSTSGDIATCKIYRR